MIDTTTEKVATSAISFYMDWSYPTLMRWLKRYRDGDVVCNKRGYPKQEYDLAFLEGKIKPLKHGRKRTKGTESLLKLKIAPRNIIRSLLRNTRDELNKKRRDECCHVRWNKPGTVWAMDDTLLKYDPNGKRRYLTNIQDLSSRFKLSYDTAVNPTGEDIAEKLKSLFKQHGAPLFIKRDNGSNFCSKEVNEVLKEYMVIPINSPVNSPKYNGSIERSQAEIKAEIDVQHLNQADAKMLDLHIKDICNKLNHKARSSLKDRHPCECFTQRNRYHKRKRKEIYDKVKYYTRNILNELKCEQTKTKVYTAARQAAKQVMLELGIINITLERTGSENVLPL